MNEGGAEEGARGGGGDGRVGMSFGHRNDSSLPRYTEDSGDDCCDSSGSCNVDGGRGVRGRAKEEDGVGEETGDEEKNDERASVAVCATAGERRCW